MFLSLCCYSIVVNYNNPYKVYLVGNSIKMTNQTSIDFQEDIRKFQRENPQLKIAETTRQLWREKYFPKKDERETLEGLTATQIEGYFWMPNVQIREFAPDSEEWKPLSSVDAQIKERLKGRKQIPLSEFFDIHESLRVGKIVGDLSRMVFKPREKWNDPLKTSEVVADLTPEFSADSLDSGNRYVFHLEISSKFNQASLKRKAVREEKLRGEQLRAEQKKKFKEERIKQITREGAEKIFEQEEKQRQELDKKAEEEKLNLKLDFDAILNQVQEVNQKLESAKSQATIDKLNSEKLNLKSKADIIGPQLIGLGVLVSPINWDS
jgi:hypothetical protein